MDPDGNPTAPHRHIERLPVTCETVNRMSRSDSCTNWRKPERKGDRNALQRTMDLSSAKRPPRASIPSSRLSELRNGEKPKRPRALQSPAPASRGLPETVSGLLFEREPRRRLGEDGTAERRDHRRPRISPGAGRGRTAPGQFPRARHAVLLGGPPGNGKTTLAEVIATELGLPFLSVRYDGVVDSYLGEKRPLRIRRIIDYASARRASCSSTSSTRSGRSAATSTRRRDQAGGEFAPAAAGLVAGPLQSWSAPRTIPSCSIGRCGGGSSSA